MKKLFISFLIAFICVGTLISCNDEAKKEELRMAYENQNLVFTDIAHTNGAYDIYLPINLRDPNPESISCFTYVYLAYYRKETGNDLTYEQVIDYLSQEFEDDGEVRIYTNGRHPEIAAYIEWTEENEKEMIDYSNELDNLFYAYAHEHEDFATCVTYLLPTEMVDELIKKEADPDYEMDLLSIQQRWLDEGRARLSEDGRKIEYLPAS